MELPDQLSTLQAQAERQLRVIDTREKTKNALVLPFFKALGYDPFNLHEVQPGYVVDRAGGDAVTVDYAVLNDDAPALLVQCAEAGTDLQALDGTSVLEGLAAAGGGIAAVTNGCQYHFYATSEAEGAEADAPFLAFDLLDYETEGNAEPASVQYIRRLTKPNFDAQEARMAAFNLKYTRRLQDYFVQQQETPDRHFVRFLAAQVYEGSVSEEVLDWFHPVVQASLEHLDIPEAKAREQALDAGASSARPEAPVESNGAEREPPAESTEPAPPAEDRPETPEEQGAPPHGPKNGEEAAGADAGDPDAEEPAEKPKEGNIGEEFARKVIGDF